MRGIPDSYVLLKDYILRVEQRYNTPHRGSTEGAEEFELDTKSYCVLCHAAFEAFLENICLNVVNNLVDEFQNNLCISLATLSFLHFYAVEQSLEDDKWKDDDRLYDYILKKLEKGKSEYSKYVVEQNHGVKLKYMKKLLIPLGLDLPINVVQTNSLTQLSLYRGIFAHDLKSADKPISPEDAYVIVHDVLDLFMDLSVKAQSIVFFRYKT